MPVLPTDIFEDCSVETVNTVEGLFIPLASLPGLTAAEANPTTGDGREMLRVLTKTAHDNLSTLATPSSRANSSYQEAILTESRRRQDIGFAFEVIVPQTSYQMADE